LSVGCEDDAKGAQDVCWGADPEKRGKKGLSSRTTKHFVGNCQTKGGEGGQGTRKYENERFTIQQPATGIKDRGAVVAKKSGEATRQNQKQVVDHSENPSGAKRPP